MSNQLRVVCRNCKSFDLDDYTCETLSEYMNCPNGQHHSFCISNPDSFFCAEFARVENGKTKTYAELFEENKRMKEALEDIIKHSKIVNPTGFHLSGFHAIASKGLKVEK